MPLWKRLQAGHLRFSENYGILRQHKSLCAANKVFYTCIPPDTMSPLLVSWIGNTDLRAPLEEETVGIGPIAQACAKRQFDRVVLLTDFPDQKTSGYRKWLKARLSCPLEIKSVALSGPTDFGDIYRGAKGVVDEIVATFGPETELVFHLSPGTPAMAAIWIILAKTRFPAELIESSPKHGVKTASVPFEIAADFLPDLLQRSDRKLADLSAASAPVAPEFSDVLHRSPVMARAVSKAQQAAPRSVPVLLEGESGTGKELFARAIHRASGRRDKAFIAVNCGAIPAELVESELFGFEKAAFTGADRSKPGYFEAADGGTLFLDELGELPLPAQVKILRVLQENEVQRLGGKQAIRIGVRVIAATNRNLLDEIAAGRFRADLFYRLAVAVIKLPPLRERQGDLSFLIDRLLGQVNKESSSEPGYKQKTLSVAARKLMLRQSWPGNVRELLNTIRRAAIWSQSTEIGVDDIRDALFPGPASQQVEILDRPLGEGFDLSKLLETVAQHYLARAIEDSGGNKTHAAELLGLASYQTFTNWLTRYKVSSGMRRAIPNSTRGDSRRE